MLERASLPALRTRGGARGAQDEDCINAPGSWDFMISYTQRNANAKLLATELYTSLERRGKTVWLDVKMDQLNQAAMKEAAQNSGCIIAVISGVEREGDSEGTAYFKRPYCINELRWARKAGVPIQPVIGRDDRDQIGTFIEQAPEDLKDLGEVDFLSMDCISPAIWDTCIDQVLRGVERTISSRLEPEPEPDFSESSDMDSDESVEISAADRVAAILGGAE